MDLTVKTPATLFSIDKQLVKDGKRIRNASEDTLIDFWIAVADAFIEKETNRALMQQTFTLKLRRVLPCVTLPRPPFGQVISAHTVIDGETTTIDLSAITDRKEFMLTVIDLAGVAEADGTMEIEYTAGAAAQTDVPAPLRQASFLLASHYVTSREAAYMDPRLMQVEKKIAYGVDQLLKNYRITNNNEPINGGW